MPFLIAFFELGISQFAGPSPANVFVIMGFLYSCQFITSFWPLHSFREEDPSREINTSFSE